MNILHQNKWTKIIVKKMRNGNDERRKKRKKKKRNDWPKKVESESVIGFEQNERNAVEKSERKNFKRRVMMALAVKTMRDASGRKNTNDLKKTAMATTTNIRKSIRNADTTAKTRRIANSRERRKIERSRNEIGKNETTTTTTANAQERTENPLVTATERIQKRIRIHKKYREP